MKSISTVAAPNPVFAVDSADNVYLVPGGEPNVSKWDTTSETEVIEFSSAVSALAVNPATNNLFVDQANAIAEYGPFGEPYSEPLSKFPNEGLAESQGSRSLPRARLCDPEQGGQRRDLRRSGGPRRRDHRTCRELHN